MSLCHGTDLGDVISIGSGDRLLRLSVLIAIDVTAMARRLRWLALCLLVTLPMQSLFAQGGPPMLADDPDTPGAGGWEINIAYTDLRTTGGRSRSFPHVDANYGLGERIQLKYETGWVYADAPEGGGVKSGLDNSLLGVKWRFLDQPDVGFNLSTYPQLELENTHNSVTRGIVDPAPNFFLPFEISPELGALKLVGEVGYQFRHADANEWVVGVLVAFHVSEALELMAEVRSVGPQFLKHSDVVVNTGLRYELGPHLKLLAAVGSGVTNVPDSTRLIAYLGVQLLFGKEEEHH